MAVLFISHASKDDVRASALEAWLNANGFTDLFVDHHSIAGGDKWAEALRASAGACRVVLCLVSPNWLSSIECFSCKSLNLILRTTSDLAIHLGGNYRRADPLLSMTAFQAAAEGGHDH